MVYLNNDTFNRRMVGAPSPCPPSVSSEALDTPHAAVENEKLRTSQAARTL